MSYCRKGIQVERLRARGTEGITLIIFEETLTDGSKVYDVCVKIPGDGGSPELRPEKTYEYHATDLREAQLIYQEILDATQILDEILGKFEDIT